MDPRRLDNALAQLQEDNQAVVIVTLPLDKQEQPTVVYTGSADTAWSLLKLAEERVRHVRDSENNSRN